MSLSAWHCRVPSNGARVSTSTNGIDERPQALHRIPAELISSSNAPQALKPLNDKLDALSPDERANYRLEGDALSAIQWRAIEKLYGEQVRR